jgi:hypothetical protein
MTFVERIWNFSMAVLFSLATDRQLCMKDNATVAGNPSARFIYLEQCFSVRECPLDSLGLWYIFNHIIPTRRRRRAIGIVGFRLKPSSDSVGHCSP